MNNIEIRIDKAALIADAFEFESGLKTFIIDFRKMIFKVYAEFMQGVEEVHARIITQHGVLEVCRAWAFAIPLFVIVIKLFHVWMGDVGIKIAVYIGIQRVKILKTICQISLPPRISVQCKVIFGIRFSYLTQYRFYFKYGI